MMLFLFQALSLYPCSILKRSTFHLVVSQPEKVRNELVKHFGPVKNYTCSLTIMHTYMSILSTKQTLEKNLKAKHAKANLHLQAWKTDLPQDQHVFSATQ